MVCKPCPMCHETKKVTVNLPCPACKGYGLVPDQNGSFIPCQATDCSNGVVEYEITCPRCNGQGTIPA